MKSENSDVRSRLKYFLKQSRITQDGFAKSLGLSRGYVNAIRDSIGSKTLERVLEKYPKLNRDWLLFGEGDMVNSPVNQAINNGTINGNMNTNYNSNTSPISSSNSNEDIVDAIPYVDTSIVRKRNFDVREAINNDADFIQQRTVGELFSPIDYYQKMADDSMQSMIQQGDFIFVKFLPKDANLVDGSVYLIFTKSYGILVRQVKVVNGEDFILHALNSNYGDIVVHRDDIKDFGLIAHLLRSTFNMPQNFSTLDHIAKKSTEQVDKLIDEVQKQNERLDNERDKNDKLVNALLSKIN